MEKKNNVLEHSILICLKATLDVVITAYSSPRGAAVRQAAAAKSEALLEWHLSGGSNRWWIIRTEKLLFLPNVKQQQGPLFEERTLKLLIRRRCNALSHSTENEPIQWAQSKPQSEK